MDELKNIVQRRITIENPDDLELVLDCINLHTVYNLVLNNGKFIFTTMSMDDEQVARITDLLDTFGIDYTVEDIAWEEVVKAVEALEPDPIDWRDDEASESIEDSEDA